VKPVLQAELARNDLPRSNVPVFNIDSFEVAPAVATAERLFLFTNITSCGGRLSENPRLKSHEQAGPEFVRAPVATG